MYGMYTIFRYIYKYLVSHLDIEILCSSGSSGRLSHGVYLRGRTGRRLPHQWTAPSTSYSRSCGRVHLIYMLGEVSISVSHAYIHMYIHNTLCINTTHHTYYDANLLLYTHLSAIISLQLGNIPPPTHILIEGSQTRVYMHTRKLGYSVI